jgi:hypothetical protein
VIFLSCLISFGFYLNNYFGEYSTNFSGSWQYGYRDAMDYVNREGNKYDTIFITKSLGEAHIFYSFYSSLDPKIIQPGGDNIRYEKTGWFWTDKIGKVYFINEWDIPNAKQIDYLKLESGGNISTKKSLLITTSGHTPLNANVKETVKLKNGESALIITTIP